jgi:enoyl-CoA hydratase/carnithine racemase
MLGARIQVEDRGHVRLIGLARPEKRNAFDLAALRALATAYRDADAAEAVRCVVLHALGEHFTAGLDLADVAPAVRGGDGLPEDPALPDPLRIRNEGISKPVVAAVQGWTLTIGIELMLAADIRVAASDARFGQIEVRRGIFPFGGATVRFVRETGWGNAMRHLLTGDTFDAAEALRIGLVQEVVKPGAQLERALAIAQEVAAQAPLGVRATLLNARGAVRASELVAIAGFAELLDLVMTSEDAAEGLASFIERRQAEFRGR